MRMDKRLKILTVLTAIAIMTVAIVYASYWIYSNVVPKTITDYSLTLNVENNGLQVTFTATLIDPSKYPVSGKTVEFGYYDASNAFHYLGESTTDTNGVATYTTTVTAGTYNFVARASVP
jgi:hypothetical protein